MPSAHFDKGPSGAHRWRKCPGSLKAERGLPDDAGIEAAQGQVFHEYADMCLSFGLDPQVFVGAPYEHEKFGLLYFDQEMADSMLYGLDYLREIASDDGAELYVEQQVDISPWVGHDEDGNPGFGTSDAGVINHKTRRITVFDWKYGMIPVLPFWNDQAILYCLGFWNEVAEALFEGVDPKEIAVDIVIEQPRAPGGGGVWHTDMATILREGHKIRLDAAACDDPDAERIPGPKQCQWCKASKKGRCPEYLEMQLNVFDLKLEEVDDLAELGVAPVMPVVVTPERRAYILQFKPIFERFFQDLHAAAYKDAMRGKADPGMKLVSGRAPARAWKDNEKQKPILERRFGDEAYERKLRSPTQIEGIVGKREFKERYAHHVLEQEAKPILVPVTDRREPLKDNLTRFEDAMDEDELV